MVTFTGGHNIAMKVPPHQWQETVEFYRDVLGLPELPAGESAIPTVAFAFGGIRLWIDSVDTASHAELWLEVTTTDPAGAAEHLRGHGIARRDEIEPLPTDSTGFWITNPASIIHLVAEPSADTDTD